MLRAHYGINASVRSDFQVTRSKFALESGSHPRIMSLIKDKNCSILLPYAVA